jgi:hypothetical protein
VRYGNRKRRRLQSLGRFVCRAVYGCRSADRLRPRRRNPPLELPPGPAAVDRQPSACGHPEKLCRLVTFARYTSCAQGVIGRSAAVKGPATLRAVNRPLLQQVTARRKRKIRGVCGTAVINGSTVEAIVGFRRQMVTEVRPVSHWVSQLDRIDFRHLSTRRLASSRCARMLGRITGGPAGDGSMVTVISCAITVPRRSALIFPIVCGGRRNRRHRSTSPAGPIVSVRPTLIRARSCAVHAFSWCVSTSPVTKICANASSRLCNLSRSPADARR